MIEVKELVSRGFAKDVVIGENGKGIKVVGLSGSKEDFENTDFCGICYDVSLLNKKSKVAIGIMFDIVRKHISRGDKLEFHHFDLPLVVSNNFSAKDFLELWGNVADEIYFSFGFKLAWEYVENTADHCKTYLDDKETYKTVHIFECSDDLFACLYSLSLDLFDEPQIENDEIKGTKTRLYSSDVKAVPADNRKQRDGKAEKAKTAENTAKKEADAKTVAEAKQIVAEAKTAEVTAEEEVKNEEKAMQRKADALNADTVATIYETTIRRIGLVLGVKWEDMDKKQKNAIKDALIDHVKMLENGSVM